ncbi:MAG: hypothetical protein SPI59_04500 [Finegoldia sp.]|nr:hypothetical protein [Finegoldia sp.]
MSERIRDGLEGIDYSDFSLRATMNDLETVRIYTDNDYFVAGDAVSFDSEAENISAINYFCGSFLASLLKMLVQKSKLYKVDIEEIEGKIDFTLTNPLNLLAVKGYDNPSDIERINIKIYYYAEGDQDDLNEIFLEILKSNPIYRLIDKSVDLSISLNMVI